MEKMFEEYGLRFSSVNCFVSCNFYKILVGVALAYTVFKIFKVCFGRRKLPPGPWGLPLVGYLPFISDQIPYLTFNKLAQKYGPVFGLQIGFRYCVVLNDYDSVKEAYKKDCFNGRPPGTFELPSKSPNIGEISGTDWTEHRKLFGNFTRAITKSESDGISLLEDIITREADILVEKITARLYYKEHEPINVRHFMDETMYKIVVEYLMGKDELRPQDKHVMDALLGQHTPLLSSGMVKAMTPTFYSLRLLTKWLDPMYVDYKFHTGHLENMLRLVVKFHRSDSHEKNTSKNYTDNFLIHQKQNPDSATFSDKTLIGNLEALLAGGTHTIKTTLEWLFTILSEKQDVQEKVYQEIQTVVQDGQNIKWKDRLRLPYTHAVILESMRLFTITPINTPRLVTEDTTVMGYDIPRGTVVFSNNWQINHDPKYWKEPFVFLPERFIDQDSGQINAKSTERISSFSYGKRECPGKVQSMMQIMIFLSKILQKFIILPPSTDKAQLDEYQQTMFSMPASPDIKFKFR